MVKEIVDHLLMVLFKKCNMDADKTVPAVNISLARFIGGLKNQVITGNIQGAWDKDKLVVVVTAVGVTL